MTKTKSTKRALLMSALSLLMCVSMLIGSTFAWFTDSVTSAGNTIQSGTLDVDLVDAQGNSLAGKVLEFVDQDDNDLWEPGCTYNLQEVYVANKGNLALKYEIVINGITGDAKLLEAIEWTVTVDGTTTELADLKGYLLAGETSKAIVLSGHMKEEAGNEYQDLTVDGISISVFATQYTYEKDSIDDQYDDIAFVSNVDALKAAIAEGKNVMLTADVALNADTTITVADGASVVLDLNGHDISAASSATGSNRKAFTVKGEMSVIGNGTVSYVHTGADMNWGYLTAAFSVEGGTLTLGEGVSVVNNGGNAMAYGVDVNTTLGAATLNVKGATIYSTYTGVRIFNNHKTAKGTVNFDEGSIAGGSRDIWAQNTNANAVDANAVVNIADDYNYDMTVQAETSFYGRIYSITGCDVVTDTAGLKAALKSATAGNTIAILADINVGGDVIRIPDGVTVDGNGHSLKQVRIVLNELYGGNNVTLKNIVFEDIGTGTNYSYVEIDNVSATIENCTFDSPEWDALQICTFDTKDHTIVINNCTFKDTLELAYRYLHIETSKALAQDPNNGIKVILTNNHFENLDGCDEDGITISGIYPANMTLSGNTYTATSAEAALAECWIRIHNGTSNVDPGVNIFQ